MRKEEEKGKADSVQTEMETDRRKKYETYNVTHPLFWNKSFFGMSHKPNDEVDMRWPLRNFILRILFSCLLPSFLFSVITMKIIAEV